MRRQAVARARHASARTEMPADAYHGWFSCRRDHPRRRVTSLAGPWAAGVDARAAEIHLQGQFDRPTEEEIYGADDEEADTQDGDDTDDDFADDESLEEWDYDAGEPLFPGGWNFYYDETSLQFEPLLTDGDAGDDPLDEQDGLRGPDAALLAARVRHSDWNGGQVIVVTNGSFLLNLPLVNPQHRRLAGRLIDECGRPGKVVFWEGPQFSGKPAVEQENQWAALTTWPMNFILLHLAALGFIYLMQRFPIFGRPQQLPEPSTSDFERHIEALGDLMSATGDAGWAAAKIKTYRETVRPEAVEE